MGSWIVAIVLTAIVLLILYKLKKDKKQGKSSCGNNCGCCPNATLCHDTAKPKK